MGEVDLDSPLCNCLQECNKKEMKAQHDVAAPALCRGGIFHKEVCMIDLFPQQSRTSVLRYPGGKTRAVEHIRSFFPKEIDTLASPFKGGGSIEISCAADGIKVFAADAFAPLVNFWQHAKKDAGALADRVAMTGNDNYL